MYIYRYVCKQLTDVEIQLLYFNTRNTMKRWAYECNIAIHEYVKRT